MELLEQVGELFTLAGFSVLKDVERAGYQLDLYAEKDLPSEYENLTVACMHAPSEGAVRQMILHLDRICKSIAVNKMILVIGDIPFPGEDRMLAKQKDILIWKDENVSYYLEDLRKDPEKGTRKLLAGLGVGSFVNIEDKVGEIKHSGPNQ